MHGDSPTWQDPTLSVLKTFPWKPEDSGVIKKEEDWPLLLKIRPEDVGLDTKGMGGEGGKMGGKDFKDEDMKNEGMKLREAMPEKDDERIMSTKVNEEKIELV